mgnify:FL=1
MPLTLRIALIAITLIYILLILRSIRRKKMNVSFSIFWIIAGFILIIFAIVPNMVEAISKMLGFEAPSNMLFVLTIFIAFYLIFNLTTIISQENKKNVLLVQEVSLLKKKVKELEEKMNDKKQG